MAKIDFFVILEFGETPIYVKDKKSLFECDGLIIPGGESTVMSKMLDYNDLRKSNYETYLTEIGILISEIDLFLRNKYPIEHKKIKSINGDFCILKSKSIAQKNKEKI